MRWIIPARDRYSSTVRLLKLLYLILFLGWSAYVIWAAGDILDCSFRTAFLTGGLYLIPAYLLQSLLHETGHLLGGLLEGDRFLLFRFLFIRVERYRGRLGIYGDRPAFQCVMIPGRKDGAHALYLLSGIFLNAGMTAAAGALAIRLNDGSRLVVFLVALSAMGLCKVVANGIAWKADGRPLSDFAFFLLINMDERAKEEYYIYLHCFERYRNDFELGPVREAKSIAGRHYCSVFADAIRELQESRQSKN